MKRRAWSNALLLTASLLAGSMLCFAAANGGWLKKVPPADRVRVNPYARNSEAIAAGQNLFLDNCAKCHGQNAEGHGKRPSLKSARLENATDGEIFWIIKNGQLYQGMPSWGGLPDQERWQLVTYLRSLNAPAAAVPTPQSQE